MSNGKNRYRKLRKRSFWSDKRAASVALTTLIITAGVVAAGISVLYWAYSWGTVANAEYSQAIGSSQNATQERIAFEFATYSEGQLTVYLLNCGVVNDVKVARVYVWDNSSQLVGNFVPDEPGLMYLSDHLPILSNSLDVSDEGYFTVTIDPVLERGFYTFRVVTERGRNFDGSFSAS